MSGCHEPKEEPKILTDLRAMADDILSLIGQLEGLDEKVSQHWDLNYKAQENLSKRIHEISDTCIHNNGIVCKDLDTLEERVNTINSSVLTAGATEMFIESNVRNIHKRIDELPSSDYDERINDLENIGVEQRLIRIENCFRSVLDSGKKIGISKDKLIERKPHKCPVCESKGLVFVMYSITDSHQVKCKSCDGTGVVWG